jgi:hypothetical protein
VARSEKMETRLPLLIFFDGSISWPTPKVEISHNPT